MRTKNPKPMSFVIDGQNYRQTSMEEHEQPSGRSIQLMVFRTECPICSAPFTLTASRRQARDREVVRRCPEHRRAGYPVKTQLAHLAAARVHAAAQEHRAAILGMFD